MHCFIPPRSPSYFSSQTPQAHAPGPPDITRRQDAVFATSVFSCLGGKSSIPWEAGCTSQREMYSIQCNDQDQWLNADFNHPVHMLCFVENVSPSGDTFAPEVCVDGPSLLPGMQLTYNMEPLAGKCMGFIDMAPNVPHVVVFQAHRDTNPDAPYSFLYQQLIVQSAAEAADPALDKLGRLPINSRLTVNVNFVIPCSKVEWAGDLEDMALDGTAIHVNGDANSVQLEIKNPEYFDGTEAFGTARDRMWSTMSQPATRIAAPLDCFNGCANWVVIYACAFASVTGCNIAKPIPQLLSHPATQITRASARSLAAERNASWTSRRVVVFTHGTKRQEMPEAPTVTAQDGLVLLSTGQIVPHRMGLRQSSLGVLRQGDAPRSPVERRFPVPQKARGGGHLRPVGRSCRRGRRPCGHETERVIDGNCELGLGRLRHG